MDFTALKDYMDRLTAWRMPGNSIRVCLDGEEVFSYCSFHDNLLFRLVEPFLKTSCFHCLATQTLNTTHLLW